MVSQVERWNTKFKAVKDYKASNNGDFPSHRYGDGLTLGIWLSEQRYSLQQDLCGKKNLEGRAKEVERKIAALLSIGVHISTPTIRIPKETEKWQIQLNKVINFQARHKGRLPTSRDDPYLARWLSDQAYFLGKQLFSGDKHHSKIARERIQACNDAGLHLFSPKCPLKHRRHRKNTLTWRAVIIKCYKDDEVHARRMKALKEYLDLFASATLKKHGFKIQTEYKSVEDYVLACMEFGDIPWKDCVREAKMWTMRHVLSYLVEPVDHGKDPRIVPDKTVDKNRRSCHFSAESIRNADPELQEVVGIIKRDLPKWLREMLDNRSADAPKYTPKELQALVHSNPKWFFPLKVSTLGHNPRGGTKAITQTSHSAPRRAVASSEIHGPEYSKKYKCHTEGLAGYLQSNFTPICYMGCRCLRDYGSVAELGIRLWLLLWHYLDPVSQVLPPNGVSILTYFGLFDGKIPSHQDNYPNTGIDPQNNSQILGSSIIVYTLGHEAELTFTRVAKEKGLAAKFPLGDGCVYILSSLDDLEYRHGAEFATGADGGDESQLPKALKARMAFIFRWLGRRTDAFCMDYEGVRQGCELHVSPNTIVEKNFPGSMDCRTIFWITRSNNKAQHPKEVVEANPGAIQKKARESKKGKRKKQANDINTVVPQVVQKKARHSKEAVKANPVSFLTRVKEWKETKAKNEDNNMKTVVPQAVQKRARWKDKGQPPLVTANPRSFQKNARQHVELKLEENAVDGSRTEAIEKQVTAGKGSGRKPVNRRHYLCGRITAK
jgi:hypothetical protein